ncbi:methionyl-tRNA formyltransferase [Patescibacteria group bacterium]|nr:methionyl-tRNA formyltransferase [Patescibacteria group bacterium]
MKTINNLKFVFFGTPDLAVFVLEELAEAGYLPMLVITAPDLKVGRGNHYDSPPVKKWAETRGIPTLQPSAIDESFINLLSEKEYDVFILTAYGKILSKKILTIPKHGILNIHPSMLPRLRGPSPVKSAILNNERNTGTTIIVLDEKMDHGPIITQESVETKDKDWPPLLPILEEKLFRLGGKLLVKVIKDYIKEKITPKPQDESRATYCEKIKKEDGLVDLLNDSPKEIYIKYCAFFGWPGIYFIKNGKRIKITKARIENDKFIIERVIPENGKEMDYR